VALLGGGLRYPLCVEETAAWLAIADSPGLPPHIRTAPTVRVAAL